MEKQYNQRIRRCPESGNTYRFTENDTKKYQTGKHEVMMEFMISISRIHLHLGHINTRNEQMPTRSTRTKWMTKERSH